RYFSVDVEPMAVLYSFAELADKVRRPDGIWKFTAENSICLIDSATGRLIEWKASSENDAQAEDSARLATEKLGVDRLRSELFNPSMKTLQDDRAPLAALFSFVGAVIESQSWADHSEQERWSAGMGFLDALGRRIERLR